MPHAEYDTCRPRSSATTSRPSPASRLACEAADIPAASPPTTTTRWVMRVRLRAPHPRRRRRQGAQTESFEDRPAVGRGVDLQELEPARRSLVGPAGDEALVDAASAVLRQGAAAPQGREVGAAVEVDPSGA